MAPVDDATGFEATAFPGATNSRIVAAYRQRTPGSGELACQAAALLPSGIAHDGRHLDPYGVYIVRASGPHKWDVDGNRYIDFYGGHGALILGHCHPRVTAAVARAAGEGTQFGANHPGEIGWARAIQRLVPAVERVRFTSSGTEATLMAVRLARAFTGRDTVLRFKGHFHGWNDHMTHGHVSHFDGTPTTGVLAGVAESAILAPPGDLAAVAAILGRRTDIAAAILEPTGASFGQVPVDPEFLHGLRALTALHGVLLIFDEVVTGFRTSRGGAQVAFGIRPDISTFAKIVAGGMPGAAVAGRQRHPRPARFRRDRSGGAREDQPSRHLQRQPGLRRGRHRLPDGTRRDRRQRSGRRARGRIAGRTERNAGGGRPALGGLWHQLGLSPVHQPEPAGRRPPGPLRPACLQPRGD